MTLLCCSINRVMPPGEFARLPVRMLKEVYEKSSLSGYAAASSGYTTIDSDTDEAEASSDYATSGAVGNDNNASRAVPAGPAPPALLRTSSYSTFF